MTIVFFHISIWNNRCKRLGMRLCVLHNLYFYNELMAKIRTEIERGAFTEFYGHYREILDKQL